MHEKDFVLILFFTKEKGGIHVYRSVMGAFGNCLVSRAKMICWRQRALGPLKRFSGFFISLPLFILHFELSLAPSFSFYILHLPQLYPCYSQVIPNIYPSYSHVIPNVVPEESPIHCPYLACGAYTDCL